ncbi:MAG: hypothetical protein ACM3N4_10840 [Nitrososphaerota archaeon]
MTTTAIFLALALGSIVLFSTIFLVVLILMRNRWQHLGDPKDRIRFNDSQQPHDQPDA